MKRLCLFCGSNVGASGAYAIAAQELMTALMTRGIGLVYGGGNVGLMGAAADAARAARLEVVGVIPEALVARELAHDGLTALHIVGSMHERKAMMADLSDGFIALPGGFGTLDELCEILTWAQLGLHGKPCGLLNVEEFFAPFLQQIERAVQEGFIRPAHQALLLVDTNADALLEKMLAYRSPGLPKWIDREDA